MLLHMTASQPWFARPVSVRMNGLHAGLAMRCSSSGCPTCSTGTACKLADLMIHASVPSCMPISQLQFPQSEEPGIEEPGA